MREWRNWQTRTFEGRVVHTVRVQVPFLAPERADGYSSAFSLLRNRRPTLRSNSISKTQFCVSALFEGRVVHTIAVQVPFLAPERADGYSSAFSFLQIQIVDNIRLLMYNCIIKKINRCLERNAIIYDKTKMVRHR